MKNILTTTIALCFCLAAGTIQAQWQTSGGNIFYNNGNVGIGTSNPLSKLEIAGQINATGYEAPINLPAIGYSFSDRFTHDQFIMPNFSLGWFRDSWYPGGPSLWVSGWGGIKFFTRSSPRLIITNSGDVGIGTTETGSDKLRVSTGNQFFRVIEDGIGITDKDWTNTLLMSNYGTRAEIFHNGGKPLILQYQAQGNVGIGTINPTAKLTVAGDIRAREIKVEANAGADFVFDADYRLRSLPEVEQFITANKHLPDIAPANEMVQNGVDMGEMQIKLLQKIEELTLYVIEQQKQIENLKQLITEKDQR